MIFQHFISITFKIQKWNLWFKFFWNVFLQICDQPYKIREDAIIARTVLYFVKSVRYQTWCLNLLTLNTTKYTLNWYMKFKHDIITWYCYMKLHYNYLYRSQSPYICMVTDPYRKGLTNTTYFLPFLGNNYILFI